MTTPYTKAAALRILIGVARKILSVNAEVRRRDGRIINIVQVTYISSINGGKCSTFLSKKAFVVVNVDFRTKGAELVEVIEVVDDDTFTVLSHKSGNHYVVRPYHWDKKKRCECGDCYWRGANCKHQIAVAQFLTGQLIAA